MKKLIILDGNALLHRAYHAIQPLTDPKGRIVNALYGFVRVFMKAVKELSPDYVAVAWDRKEETFRHKIYKEYKAQREKKPQELYDQIPMIKNFLSILAVPSYEARGFEADDLIATIAEKTKTRVDQVVVLTGDMDVLQIVDDKTSILALKKGVSETENYTPQTIYEKYGLTPSELVDYKALLGDPSDNIRGIEGIGKISAGYLIKEYKNLDNIYKNLEEGTLKAQEGIKERLGRGKKDAYLARDLVRLKKDAPIKFSLEEMRLDKYDEQRLQKFFVEYGFRSLLNASGGASTAKEEKKLKIIKNAEELDLSLRGLKKPDEILFYIQEGQEGLFGKEIEGLSLVFGGQFIKIIFDQKLKPAGVFEKLKNIFEDEKIKKSGYNLKNEMYTLKKFGAALCGAYFDIMIAGYLLRPGERQYKLETLILKYLKKSLSKDPGLDLMLLKNYLAKKIEEEKLGKVFFEIEMPLLSALFRMEQNGIKIDKEKLAGLSRDFAERLKIIDKKIYVLAGEEFNIDSPRQLKIILYDKLGLRPTSGHIRRGKTGLSTAASELEKFAGAHQIIDLILEHRELHKLKTTYVDALPKMLDQKNRAHTSFNQTITSTGRLSSSGPNLQNIPTRTDLGKKIREAFIAEGGFILLSLDYSQIELRLAAALTGERHMILAFGRGEDIHRQTAAEIFRVPEDKVTDKMRSWAKAINFGVLYGMGVGGLAAGTGMSREEAENFLAQYQAAHPAIMDYIERTKALAYKTGYVETLFGRRRYLPEIHSGIPQLRAAAERMAINMPIQGTAADIIKMAMIEIDKNICDENIKMVLQVHDELVFEVKKNLAKSAARDIKEVMENICRLKVALEVKVTMGERWE